MAGKRLTADDERALHARMHGEDAADAVLAMHELVEANYGWAALYAGLWAAHESSSIEEIESDNRLALIHAANTFDPGKGRFTTWAFQQFRRQRTERFRRVQNRTELCTARGTRSIMQVEVDVSKLPSTHPICDIVANKERRELITEALRYIPKRAREILVARFWRGETLLQVAESHGITRERVRQIASKALKRLRELLAELDSPDNRAA